jgi:hypothetical protein
MDVVDRISNQIPQEMFDRVDEDGVATCSTRDGHIFLFTAGTLRRLLSDAESSDGRVIVFVRSPAEGSS